MNISAAVLAIPLCLEAQQHHRSLAEETTPTVPFALGFSPMPTFSAHLSPFHLSVLLLQQRLSTVNNSAAAASALFPVAFCSFPHATVCSPCLSSSAEGRGGISSQRKLMVQLYCNLRWVERTSSISHPVFMAVVTRHFSCYLGVCYSKKRY